ncbi:hypothetical protein ACJRO7_029039 [Eucalyptus globulus]|uniref:Uncharacterized protein n=1 Tax=Eucalyptus globulus TaxID=34317 RepID=A0ABD3JZ83_EUCGL
MGQMDSLDEASFFISGAEHNCQICRITWTKKGTATATCYNGSNRAPMAAGYPQSEYPQTGKAYPSMDPAGYPYPQAAPTYPGAVYPSPPAAPMLYAAEPQMSYPQLAVKKDQLGFLPTPPMGMGGYPYYSDKQ